MVLTQYIRDRIRYQLRFFSFGGKSWPSSPTKAAVVPVDASPGGCNHGNATQLLADASSSPNDLTVKQASWVLFYSEGFPPNVDRQKETALKSEASPKMKLKPVGGMKGSDIQNTNDELEQRPPDAEVCHLWMPTERFVALTLRFGRDPDEEYRRLRAHVLACHREQRGRGGYDVREASQADQSKQKHRRELSDVSPVYRGSCLGRASDQSARVSVGNNEAPNKEATRSTWWKSVSSKFSGSAKDQQGSKVSKWSRVMGFGGRTSRQNSSDEEQDSTVRMQKSSSEEEANRGTWNPVSNREEGIATASDQQNEYSHGEKRTRSRGKGPRRDENDPNRIRLQLRDPNESETLDACNVSTETLLDKTVVRPPRRFYLKCLFPGHCMRWLRSTYCCCGSSESDSAQNSRSWKLKGVCIFGCFSGKSGEQGNETRPPRQRAVNAYYS